MTKNRLLQNHWTNFNKTWYKAFWVKGIQVFASEGPHPFPSGDKFEIVKYFDKILKKFTPEPLG